MRNVVWLKEGGRWHEIWICCVDNQVAVAVAAVHVVDDLSTMM